LLGYAPTESLWASLKVAQLHGRHFATRRDATDEIIDWLGFYNARRAFDIELRQPYDVREELAAAQRGQAA
jgi:hypothetical protein